MLPVDTFKTIIASTPLISIDLIIRNKNGDVLLGKRINRPAQGFWFVPGGRVLKDESFALAFKRLIKVELDMFARRLHLRDNQTVSSCLGRGGQLWAHAMHQ